MQNRMIAKTLYKIGIYTSFLGCVAMTDMSKFTFGEAKSETTLARETESQFHEEGKLCSESYATDDEFIKQENIGELLHDDSKDINGGSDEEPKSYTNRNLQSKKTK